MTKQLREIKVGTKFIYYDSIGKPIGIFRKIPGDTKGRLACAWVEDLSHKRTGYPIVSAGFICSFPPTTPVELLEDRVYIKI